MPGDRDGKKKLSESEKIFRQYLKRRMAGEKVSPEEYYQKFPELEGDLHKLFDKMKKNGVEEVDLLDGGLSEKPPTVIGDFRILHEIGRGGMGRVYEAEQVSLNRRVALKILPAHLSFSDTAVKKFHREAEAGGRQSHPGIVAIHAVGEHEGIHYIAQELIEGGRTLTDRLDKFRKDVKRRPGYYREAAQLIIDVANALHHAHESGVIHRDIKPSNILLAKDGSPKVTDFGLAKVEDALALSRTGDFAGTPYYMSPEQAMSRRMGIDKRTDVYSLGVTFYEMLTLKRPFEGKTSHEVLKKIMFVEPVDPCKLDAGVPRDLSVICLKAMEKTTHHRYQDMEEYADDLLRYLNGEVILAKPASLATRITKRIKRNPVVSATSAVIVLAVLFAAANALWSYSKVVAERNKTIAVNEFLVGMFSSPDPDRDGKDMKIVDFLERASGEADKTFPEEPETRQALHTAIAKTYEALGDYRAAEAEYRTALEIVSGDEGFDEELVFEIKNSLANVLISLAGFSEADILLREVLEKCLRDPGEEHEITLNAMNSLAYVLRKTGEHLEAEVRYRRVLETRRRVLPPDHEATLSTMNDLGVLLTDLGRFDEAEDLLSRVLEKRLRVLGTEHTNTLQSMDNLAYLYRRMDKISEAVELYSEVLKIQSRILPENHSDRLTTMNNLALVLNAVNKSTEAQDLYEKALDLRRQTLGGSHPDTLQSMNNLALFHMKREEIPRAKALFQEMIDMLDRNPGKDYPPVDRLEWIKNAAWLYQTQKEYSTAELLWRQVLEELRVLYGKEDMRSLDAMNYLAFVLLKQKKYSDAEKLLSNGIEIAGRTLSLENPTRIELHNILGKTLNEQKLYGKAAEQIRVCYEGTKESRNPDAQTYLKILISLYDKSDQPEKAKEYEAYLTSPGKGEVK